MSTYAELLAESKALRAKSKEVARAAFHAGSQQIFEEQPEVNTFSWTQYTCYFNDGEECHFAVHDYDFELNGEEPYSEDCKLSPTIRNAATKSIRSLLRSFDDMEELFGDHVRVIVSRDGIKTEEYVDHD
jgi:hypothetical protein